MLFNTKKSTVNRTHIKYVFYLFCILELSLLLTTRPVS